MIFKVWSKKKVTCLSILLILSSLNFTSAEVYWDLQLDTYSYFRSEITTTFDPFWEETEIEYVNDSLEISILEYGGNSVSFEVSDNKTILKFVDCETQECMNAFLDIFKHNNESGIIELELVYDKNDETFGFLGAYYYSTSTPYVGTYCELPLHIIDLINTLTSWNGIFGIFLPLSLDDFYIDSHIDNVYSLYDEFVFNEASKFTYNNMKIEGQIYSVTYNFQEQISTLLKNITKEVEFQYLPNGVLCQYESSTNIVDIFVNEVILITEILFGMYLESGYETFKVINSFEVITITVVFVALIALKARKKN